MAQPIYVHGYSHREAERLADQAEALSELLHHDTRYPPHSMILECGCGTGAQTVILARQNPEARIVSLDISADSLATARARIATAGYRNVEFREADILHLPYADEQFDHVFLCFVLEHLPSLAAALTSVRRVLRPGGTVTVIEGDHGSWYCHPPNGRGRARSPMPDRRAGAARRRLANWPQALSTAFGSRFWQRAGRPTHGLR